MLKIYGTSDDLLEIEGAKYPFDEIGCFDSIVKICFTDNTTIEVTYGKESLGIWKISFIKRGSATQTFIECKDENADVYSDILEIDADIDKIFVNEKLYKGYEENTNEVL